MNKILLINRLNPQDYTNTKKKIFFTIGGINLPKVENKLIDILHDSGLVGQNDAVYKYNGVELDITVQQIPTIIKLLSSHNFQIYSVFEIYNPDF